MKPLPYRITHLSDLHLTSRPSEGRTEVGIFKPLYGMNDTFASLLETPALKASDRIVITGDITDKGDTLAWKFFWKTLDRHGLMDRTTVIPGNHDVCCLGARLPDFNKAYQKEDLVRAVNGLKRGQQPVRFPWSFSPDQRLVFFGLNSNNMGNLSVSTNAMGRLGYFQLKGFADELFKNRHVPVKIVLLHHSPNIPESSTAEKRGLKPYSPLARLGHQLSREQRHALLLLCITHRVRLILHGHLHVAEDRRISGVRIVGAPATTEPIITRNTGSAYQYYQYLVNHNGTNVRCQLKTTTL